MTTSWRRDDDYLDWCEAGAKIFSTCSRAQYMAIVLDVNRHIVGTGYNGSPPGYPHCIDGGCAHAAEPPGEHLIRCVAIHAEENALLHSEHQARRGGTLYVNGVPCFSCARKLAGSGLGRVVYRRVQDHDGSSEGIALMQSCGLVVEERP